MSILSDLSASHINTFWAWAVENNMIPEIIVVVSGDKELDEGLILPAHLMGKQAQVVLNIGPAASDSLIIRGEGIAFRTRFYGKSFSVRIPMEAVAAYRARELPDMLIPSLSFQSKWRQYVDETTSKFGAAKNNTPASSDRSPAPETPKAAPVEVPVAEESAGPPAQNDGKVVSLAEFRNKDRKK